MATILFMMKYPLHQQENLKAKFDGQMAAVRALGHEAYAIGWNMEGMWLIGGEERRLLQKNHCTRMPGYEHTKIFVDLMSAARKAMQHKKIDAVYLRYMPTFWNAPGTMRLLKKQGGKLVIEFPTYPREKENRRSLLRRPVFAYADRVLGRIHPMVDLYTLIGEDGGGSLDGRPAMNIVNGIDVDRFPLHAVNEDQACIRMLALASMAGWHGYDRILRSLAEYRGNSTIHLDMVGPDGDGSLAAWKALAEKLGIMEQVSFHGSLYGDALNAVVAKADVGIGSLGMFRFGLNSGMTLKLREYMARGLPFVYAVDDPSIPADQRFCLRVNNEETPIDLEALVAFAKKGKQSMETPALMREYAREHMSWTNVMDSVLERLQL